MGRKTPTKGQKKMAQRVHKPREPKTKKQSVKKLCDVWDEDAIVSAVNPVDWMKDCTGVGYKGRSWADGHWYGGPDVPMDTALWESKYTCKFRFYFKDGSKLSFSDPKVDGSHEIIGTLQKAIDLAYAPGGYFFDKPLPANLLE